MVERRWYRSLIAGGTSALLLGGMLVGVAVTPADAAGFECDDSPGSLWLGLPGQHTCEVDINASGNWVVPPGVTKVDLFVVGGGGGGGGASYQSAASANGAGGGGGGQVTSSLRLPVTPGSTVAVTIGAGGAGGRGTRGGAGLPGQAGGSSSFGSVVAPGGAGGEGAAPSGAVTLGGGSGHNFTGTSEPSLGGTSMQLGTLSVGGGGSGAGFPANGPRTLNATEIRVPGEPVLLAAGNGGAGVLTSQVGGLFATGYQGRWFGGGGAGAGSSATAQSLADGGAGGGGRSATGLAADMDATPSTGGGGGGGGIAWGYNGVPTGPRDGGSGAVGKVFLIYGYPPQISTTSLPAAKVGTSFAKTVAIDPNLYGTGPLTFTISDGALPAGLRISSTSGKISGVPTGPPGTYNFTVKVVDELACFSTRPFTIKLGAGFSITTTGLPAGSTFVPFTPTTLASSGGTAPLTWSVASGALPAGMTLSADGLLSGTPTEAGNFTFDVKVTDSAGLSSTAPFKLDIGQSPPLAITTTTLPAATTGEGYTDVLASTGGVGTHTWSIASGSLPAGLTLAADGTISGTPTGAGPSNFTVRVTTGTESVTKALTLVVRAPLVITSTTLASGATLVAYSKTLTATGGTSYTWARTSGSLPAGLSLSSAGVLSGTPTAAGTSTFTVTVTDNFGRTQSQVYTLVVAQSPALTISTTTVPDGTVGLGYTESLQASGGVGTRTWSVSAGSLPAGLVLAADGTLSGTPTTAGTSNFTVQVTTGTETVTQALTIVVRAQLEITTDTLPNAATLTAYSTVLAATGGSPYTWAVTAGSLPAGVTLDAGGTLSGTPTSAGISSFKVTVTDTFGRTVTKSFALGVSQSPALAITTTSLSAGEDDTSYVTQLQATGGVGTHTWSVSAGALPAGLTLHADGTLTGVPTTPGTSNFTVRVTTGSETVTKALSLVVRAKLAISTTNLFNGATLTPYSSTLVATGATSYTWAVTEGSLPAGLSLSSGGVLSGTPTAAGVTAFTVTVTDNYGRTESKRLAIMIAQSPALTIDTTTLPNGEVDTAYIRVLQADGGVGTRTWSVSAGSLPPGISLHSDGTLTGIPTTPGSYSFTVQVGTGTETVSQPLTMEVRALLTITTDSLPSGATNVPFSTSLAADGGAPYTWAVTAGSLPAGLTLDSDGTVHGTPTAAGLTSFTATVTDTFGRTESKVFAVGITQSAALAIDTDPLPRGSIDEGYSSQLQATGGVGTRTWSQVSGSLPPGLSLDSDGQITGTPTTTGTFTFTVRVETGTETVDREVSITIDAPVQITSSTLPSVTVGGAYSQQLTATGGDGSYTWSRVGGQMPSGLTLSASGRLSGTVSTAALAGTYVVTVQASDGFSGLDTREITFTVLSKVKVATSTLPAASAVGGYQMTLTASGGAEPYQWGEASPALPPGLSLHPSTGVLSGQVSTPGTYSFRVQVIDSHGNPATRLFTLHVKASDSVAQVQSCATLLSSMPVNGSRVVAKAGCRTDAGQLVTVTAQCVWGITTSGDLRMCAVYRDSKNRQLVRTFGRHPITLQVTLTAPAVAGYTAYRVTKTYRIR